MKKIFNIFGFLILFMIFSIINVYASECNTNEYKTLKALSKKIKVSYLFDENNKVFNVNIYNLSDKFNVSLSNGMYMFGSNSPKRELGIFEPGSSFKISIYTSSKTGCPDEVYNTIKINIPYYNKYSEYKECDNNYTLDICKKWYNTAQLTEEQFKSEINDLESKKEESGFAKTIISFITGNWMFIIPIAIIIILILIVVKVKKNKKARNSSMNLNY